MASSSSASSSTHPMSSTTAISMNNTASPSGSSNNNVTLFHENQQNRIQEASAMLLIFSFFALIEGIIRMTSNSRPSADGPIDYFGNAGGTIIPVGVLLIGGVAEVFFGIAGVFVAIFALVFQKGCSRTTLYFTITQLILGWFVFLTYVVAVPIRQAKNSPGVPNLLTPSEQGTLAILGSLVASVSFCWALQGGQFIMALRLLAAQKGEPELKSKNVTRSLVWSVNVLVAAASTLHVGLKLFAKGFTSTTAPIAAPPHVIWFPSLSIITGIIMMVYGIMGVISAQDKLMATKWLPMMWAVTTVAMMINFSWTFGIVPGLAPPIPGAAQHAGLILSVTILPVYHAWRAHHCSSSSPKTNTETNSSRPEAPRVIKKKKPTSEVSEVVSGSKTHIFVGDPPKLGGGGHESMIAQSFVSDHMDFAVNDAV